MKDLYYKSSNGVDDVHAGVWECENPKFVVQVIHGMQEHIGRYEDFAKFLNSNNVILAGEDHLGHGKTAKSLGHFGDGDTISYVLQDIHKLTQLLEKSYGVPVYLLGHSMGSFILRYYLSKYDVSKAVVMGTGNTPASIAKLLIFLAKTQEKIYGPEHRSDFLTNLTIGSFVKNTKGGHWISYNEENVKAYESDELCGFKFAPSGFLFLGSILYLIQQNSTIQNVKPYTKILFISGKDDLVGAKNGVEKVFNRYKNSGYDVEIKLFENMRHEILHENEKELVWNFLLSYFSN